MMVHVVAEGVEIGDEVAHFAVGVDEIGDLHETGPGPFCSSAAS